MLKTTRIQPKTTKMIDSILKHTTPILTSIGTAEIVSPETSKNIILATIIYLIQLGVKKLWDKYISPEKKLIR